MQKFIQEELQKLSTLLTQIQGDPALLQTVSTIADRCVEALKQGKKILFAGNGGSAADCQHLAAELVCRLRFDRPGLAAIALTTDTSALTAISNDYSFTELFARQVSALGQPGDVLIGISTSGKSPNILRALEAAKERGMKTIGFTGHDAPLLSERCDLVLHVPSRDVQKIQECHILFGHIICGIIESLMYGETQVQADVAV